MTRFPILEDLSQGVPPGGGGGGGQVGNPSPLNNVFYATSYGVKADGKCVTDASIASGTNQLHSASAAFVNADVGKLVAVQGAAAPSTGTLSGMLSTGSPITALPVNALANGIPAGGLQISVTDAGSPNLIQAANASFASPNTTGQISLTGVVANNGLVLAVAWFAASGTPTLSVADNVGGSWSHLGHFAVGTTGAQDLFYCQTSPGGSVTVTVTGTQALSGSPSAGCAYLAEWNGTGIADQFGTNSGSGTTMTSPTITPTANGELVLMFGTASDHPTVSPTAPWTAVVGPTLFSDTEAPLAYQVEAGMTGVSAAWTLNSSVTWRVVGCSIKAGGSTFFKQTYATTGAAASATSIPVVSQTPNHAYPATTTTVATINPPLLSTISSVASGVATLGVNAGTTVSGATCFYASDDTTAAQACLTDAKALRGTAEFPDGFIGLTSALLADKGVDVRGQGVKALYSSAGTYGAWDASAFPNLPPYLAGTVFWPFTPATAAIKPVALGESVNLRRFGIVFPSLHYNTGHGVDGSGLTALTTNLDNGPMDYTWEEIMVFGHDGAHHAFEIWNVEMGYYKKLRGWGGGGLHFAQKSAFGFYGNATFIDCFMFVFNCGPAHALFIENQGGSGDMDFSLFLRWQSWVGNPTFSGGGIAVPGTIHPYNNTSQQLLAAANGAVINDSTRGFVFVAPDMETNINATISSATGFFTTSVTAGVPMG